YGAIIISDTLSLIVFAICVSTFQRGFSLSGLVAQMAEIALFILFVPLGLLRRLQSAASARRMRLRTDVPGNSSFGDILFGRIGFGMKLLIAVLLLRPCLRLRIALARCLSHRRRSS